MEAYRVDGGANNKRKRASMKWHWELEEDELLTELVQRHGPKNWNFIADHISGRTGVSCRLRWTNHLNPKVDKAPFCKEEQERLLELHRDYGNKWATIADFFPGRTDYQVKSQYRALVESRIMKVSVSSSRPGTNNREGASVDVSSYVSITEGDVGSQISHNTGGCGPHSKFTTDMSTMPSAINARDETWLGPNLSRNTAHSFENANLGNINANLRTSPGCHMTSTSNFAVAQPQQGVSAKSHQFIDFLGVGNTE